MYDYKSPIAISTTYPAIEQMKNDIDGQIVRAVWKADIHVDKEQLLKALQFDKEQYDKGYNDAKAEYEKLLDKAILEIRQLYDIDSYYCDRKENSHYKECDYKCLKCERIKESILEEVQDE